MTDSAQGSVNGERVGCGVVVREFFCEDTYDETLVMKRISDGSSSTSAELYAIYEGLKVVANKEKNVFIFVDSQSALFALNSQSPQNPDVIRDCKTKIYDLKDRGCNVSFVWIPSHCGIGLNEVADGLAKTATTRSRIDVQSEINLCKIKMGMRSLRQQWDLNVFRWILDSGSQSMLHYTTVTENTNVSYGRDNARVESMIVRWRLGYKYIWEYDSSHVGIPCKLCQRERAHTLYHYTMECMELQEFRNNLIDDFYEQVCFMINNKVFKGMCKKFRKFDCRY